MLHHDEAKGVVTVSDRLILDFIGVPIKGAVMEETKARITFIWEVKMVDNSRQHTTMSYRMSYLRTGRPARITAIPAGYDNRFTADGRCTLSTR